MNRVIEVSDNPVKITRFAPFNPFSFAQSIAITKTRSEKSKQKTSINIIFVVFVWLLNLLQM